MAPIVIRHGGANFDGIGDDLARNIVAAKRLEQDDERFQLTKRRVEQEMDFAEQDRRREREQEAAFAQHSQQTAGMIGDMTRAPQGPEDPNASESQQFEASIRAQTERMGKIAAKIAETDPEKGLEYAQRFLEEGEKDLQRVAADRGVTSMLKDIGEAAGTPGTFAVTTADGSSIDDEASIEALKGVMQELESVAGPEVPVQTKLQALDNANKTRLQIRKDLTRRNQQGAAIAAGRNSVATRVAEGGTRLSTVQQGKLGGLMSNIGFEEGMVTPDKVDGEVDRILRGTVQIPNPFSFGGGGDMLEMTPESAAKLQESLAKIQESQTRQASNLALESQRKARAKDSEASAALKARTDPNARTNGKATGLRAKFDALQQKAKAEGWDRKKAEEELRKAGIDPSGPPPQ